VQILYDIYIYSIVFERRHHSSIFVCYSWSIRVWVGLWLIWTRGLHTMWMSWSIKEEVGSPNTEQGSNLRTSVVSTIKDWIWLDYLYTNSVQVQYKIILRFYVNLSSIFLQNIQHWIQFESIYCMLRKKPPLTNIGSAHSSVRIFGFSWSRVSMASFSVWFLVCLVPFKFWYSIPIRRPLCK
jgi:hypothetical protein